MILQVLEILFPILILLIIGYFCRTFKIIDQQGLSGLKQLIGKICLPVVLFNAFFYAPYNSKTVIIFICIYIGFMITLGFGFLCKKAVSPYQKFFPFLLTSAEGGMLGYALYGTLVGQNTSFALVDLGQTVFAYTVFLASLKYIDAGSVSAKSLLKNMLTNFCFVGMFLGIVLGIADVDAILLESNFGELFNSIINMIMIPTGSVVLIIVGYELDLNKGMLAPVLKTVFLRLFIMSAILIAIIFILRTTVGLDKDIYFALLILYALPAPFVIPIFADVGKDAAYISTTVSIHTLVTLLLFGAISVHYFMMN